MPAALPDASPLENGHGGSGGSSGRTPRSAGSGSENPELQERRRALSRVLGLGIPVWLAFFALDVYVVELLGATVTAEYYALLRALGLVIIGGAWLVVQRPRSATVLVAAELVACVGASAIVSVMAVLFGNLNSRYIQGISLLVMYRAAGIPDRFWPSLGKSLLMAATYPAVMGIAALASPAVRVAWTTPEARWLFLHDYVFVISTAAMVSAASHFVWAARRQVYEARKLGRYRLKARIGSGGWGEVWLARDDRNRRDVALKILHTGVATRAGSRTRFEREAKVTMMLTSPHTIRVFDFGTSDDGVCFLAMEYLDGVDLGTLVRTQGPLPPLRAVHLVRQACHSLAEAHAKGILHRDIKPENLFVLSGDFLKVLDFGLAKLTQPEFDATATQHGFLAGTPLYMAPEVCAGNEARVESDIYALGGVLYFLLTGVPPFQAEDVPSLLRAHREQSPEPPSRRAAVPPKLDRVILRCLAKQPRERFATAEALMRALDECTSDLEEPAAAGASR